MKNAVQTNNVWGFNNFYPNQRGKFVSFDFFCELMGIIKLIYHHVKNAV